MTVHPEWVRDDDGSWVGPPVPAVGGQAERKAAACRHEFLRDLRTPAQPLPGSPCTLVLERCRRCSCVRSRVRGRPLDLSLMFYGRSGRGGVAGGLAVGDDEDPDDGAARL